MGWTVHLLWYPIGLALGSVVLAGLLGWMVVLVRYYGWS
jgi:hypothetical protein